MKIVPAKQPQPDTLDVVFARITPDGIRKWLAWVTAMAGFGLTVVFAAYWMNFKDGGISQETQAWGHFGEYVGGTAGPLLTFLTVIGVVLTLALQVKQLEDSREQLKASKLELERSRKLQVTMAEAMNRQAHYATVSARIAALAASLSVTSEQLLQVQSVTMNRDTVGYDKLLRRKEALADSIAKLTDSMIDTPEAHAAKQTDKG